MPHKNKSTSLKRCTLPESSLTSACTVGIPVLGPLMLDHHVIFSFKIYINVTYLCRLLSTITCRIETKRTVAYHYLFHIPVACH